MPHIHYTISMPEPTNHLFHVEMVLRDFPQESLDLVLPVWTPGSYKVRDYARNVQDFEASVPDAAKTAKHRWRLRLSGAREARVRYRVYANELNVRGLHLDAEHGYFNGGAVFMYVDGHKHVPATVTVRPGAGWRVATALEPRGGGRYYAADYDVLVDSPVECGRFALHRWRQFGVEHRLVVHGPMNRDAREIVGDIRKIVAAGAKLFGGVPYPHYTFILHTASSDHGGLEHANSCSLQYAPFGFAPREKYERFLQLVAHEYFHLWNVKRIRPEALGPFDYERENYTKLLWAMEGVTSYYEVLLLRRAGLIPAKTALKIFAERIQQYQEKPGRKHQSLAESSFDAWIKFYNPTEHTPNAQVSYYEKGALVALLLDLEIRRRTDNRASLDDVLRMLWREHGRKGAGFPEREFQRAAERAAGARLDAFWRSYVDGKAELDFGRALRAAGCELRKEPKKGEDGEAPPLRAWLGIVGGKTGDRVAVQTVRAGSPAERAGLCARDEILAVDGLRVDADSWAKRIEDRAPGGRVRIAFLRAGFLREVEVALGRHESATYSVAKAKAPSRRAARIYGSWMGEPLAKSAAAAKRRRR